jgi:hypothetical protein
VLDEGNEEALDHLLDPKNQVAKIEEDTPEAFLKRQRLVRLLMERITLHKSEIGKTTVAITYRFRSSERALLEDYGKVEQADDFVGIEQNSGPGEAEKIFRNALSPPTFGTRKFGWA